MDPLITRHQPTYAPLHVQRVWEKLMNFALFKVIFIGAILEPSIKELLIWTVWFSIVGFMHLFSFLSKDRFQNVGPRPRRCPFTHPSRSW